MTSKFKHITVEKFESPVLVNSKNKFKNINFNLRRCCGLVVILRYSTVPPVVIPPLSLWTARLGFESMKK